MTAALRSRAVWIVIFCWLTAIGEGADLQAPGITLPVLAPLFHLSSGVGLLAGVFSAKSLFLSTSTLGLFIGAIAGGRLSDLVGRKWVLVGSIALFAAFTVITAMSTSASMLLWMRFVTGLGLGGCYPNVLAVAVESVRPQRRHAVVGLMHSAMPTGGAFVSFAAVAWATPERWRDIYYLAVALAVLALIGVVLVVPNLRPRGEIAASKASTAQSLFGEGRGLSTGLLWTACLAGMMTEYILLSWMPTLLISKGLPKAGAALAQMSFNLASVPGSIIAGALIDRRSRQVSAAAVFAGAIAALILLPLAPAQLIPSLVVAALAGFTVTGGMAVVFALAPGVYPTEGRGAGVGFAVAASRLGSVIGPLIAGAMLGAGAGSAQVLGAMTPLTLLCGVCAWLLTRKVTAPPLTNGA